MSCFGLASTSLGAIEVLFEAPSIVLQPLSRISIVGDNVILNVKANGTPPPTYQWQFNGKDIVGATEASHQIHDVTLAQDGDYAVMVKNEFGTNISALAKLTVLDPLTGLFNTAVRNDHTVLGDNQSDPHYSLVQNADGPSKEALVQDSTAFPIVKGPWLANSGSSKWIGPRFETSEAATGDYRYQIKLDLGDFDPTTVVIFGHWATDNPGLDILVNGASTGIKNTTGFGVLTPFTINRGFVSGSNTIDFVLRNEGAGYTGLRVDGLRGGGRKKSGPIVEAPRIVAHPTGKTVFAGETVSLSVVADGAKPLSFQWQRGNEILLGQTEATLTLSSSSLLDAGDYSVTVSNSAGTQPTRAAKLVVLQGVPGVFNSGLDPNGQALADGAIDPHYQLVKNPHDSQSKDAIVEDSAAFPIVAGPWVPNAMNSKWIGPRLNQNGAPGDYVFRTTFDLTGFDSETAYLEGHWATDNVGSDIVLNGRSTGLQNNTQFSALTHFTITTGFRAGLNTLEFTVNNAGFQENPTGLHVAGLRLGARPVDNPTSGPRLTVSRSANEITLAWPKTEDGYKLFSTEKLAPATWTAVAEVVMTEGAENVVKIQRSAPSRFFRLQK